MNNRIMATLFALAIALFIGVAPVKAEAAVAQHEHYDNGGTPCVCDYAGCTEPVHHLTKVEKVDANHEKPGNIEYYVCSECNKWFKDEAATEYIQKADDVVIPKIEHELVWEVKDGTHKQYCTGCGYVPVAETAHTLSKTDNGNGTHTIKCTVEGCTYEVKDAAHDDGTKKDCICGVCGAKMEHTPGENWDTSGNVNHWKVCTVCGEQLEKAEHTFTYTAGENDKHSKKCTVCEKVVETEACVDLDPVDHKCDLCGDALIHVWNGSYMNAKPVHKTATCTEDGIWLHYQCNVCGMRVKQDGTILDETTMVNPASGHTEATSWSHNPDGHWKQCVKNGVDQQHKATEVFEHEMEWKYNGSTGHYQQCKVCGRVGNTVEHTYVRTPLGNGKHETKCSVCGYVMGTFNCEDAGDDDDCVCDGCGGDVAHTITPLRTVPAVAATCTEGGYEKHYECPTCKKLFKYEGGVCTEITIADVTTEALGHDWEHRQYTLSNKHVVKCTRCDAYETMGHTDTDGDCLCDLGTCNALVHSHEHVYVEEVPATCGKAGTKAYYYYKDCGKMFDLNENPIEAPVEIPALDHVASDEFEAIDGNQHAIKCEKCGEVIKTETHVDSNEDNRCDVCKVELTLVEVPEEPATCTDIGYEKCWKSPVTDKMYADPYGNEYITSRKVIPAKGHTYTTSNGAQHICKDCGHAVNHTASKERPCFCSVCNLPIGGHTIEAVAAVEPTCTKAGTEAYVKCSCGAMYDAQGNVIAKVKSIPAKGHILDTTKVNDAAEGDHYMVCTVCGYEAHEDHAMAVKDPLKGNYHQYVCECGKVVTEKHADKDGDKICDACGHDMSGSSVKVENHDSKTVVTGEAETVDNSKSWLQNWFDNLFGSNAGGSASSSKSAKTADDGTSTQGSNAGDKSDASGNKAPEADNSGNAGSGSGSSGQSSTNTNTSTETGIINEFIQWLSQLFGAWLQGK